MSWLLSDSLSGGRKADARFLHPIENQMGHADLDTAVSADYRVAEAAAKRQVAVDVEIEKLSFVGEGCGFR